MPTVTKKPAARRRAPAKKPVVAAPRPRLTPPPGPLAADVMKNYPPPAPAADFDAEGVERIVALRASR